MTTLKIAGAPITWGVCEVPGWGAQLPVERVLREMRQVGLTATEFGPEGFLPVDPADRAAVLHDNGLVAVGGFVPVVLHRPDHDPLPALQTELEAFVAAGAGVVVLSADSGLSGYDERVELDEAGWTTLLANLVRLRDAAAAVGVLAVLHPHVGTLVESKDDVERVLAGCDVGLCLDSGHLLIGGTDPVALAQAHPERIRHVHLKDVDAATAQRVRDGELTYYQAVQEGLYRPLGQGDVDVSALLASLLGAGYDGWFVLEQDTVLQLLPGDGEGPVADAMASAEHLRRLALAEDPHA
ncbi:inosose dehydratase [Quadrisphaera granulorum]|uniref:Inosose dehydratase n=1 Tax=Quadrisphaera granulorum TaxID=317664 RepID=A0A315ZR10_9ACTN|nr:sugar phosphate isomerase/epimerase [Quadrisphaera granulorum]PWJ47739.1 inosose dehydratase [Quadrisphaera granulorum]SZE98693.1 inosose dehydratase [Quadrisphaera granulorum]